MLVLVFPFFRNWGLRRTGTSLRDGIPQLRVAFGHPI